MGDSELIIMGNRDRDRDRELLIPVADNSPGDDGAGSSSSPSSRPSIPSSSSSSRLTGREV